MRRAVASLLLCAASLALAAPQIDEPAPPLKGRLFSGADFDLAAMRGKVVLVNFYSSYCKRCAFEIGTLEASTKSTASRASRWSPSAWTTWPIAIGSSACWPSTTCPA